MKLALVTCCDIYLAISSEIVKHYFVPIVPMTYSYIITFSCARVRKWCLTLKNSVEPVLVATSD